MSTSLHDRQRSARRAKSLVVTKPSSKQRLSSFQSVSPETGLCVTNAKLSLFPDNGLWVPQLHDLMRKLIRTLEGLTGIHWDMEIFGMESIEEEEKDNDSGNEREYREGEGKIRTGKNSERDEEIEVAKELLNGNGTAGEKKVDWEIWRKALHSSIGFFTIYLYLSRGDPKIVVYTLWSALCIIGPADYLRLNYPSFAQIYERYLGFLMRESEKRGPNGVIWYIIGVNFALTFYPLDVATVAVLILSWADTAASTTGRLWAGHWGLYTPRLPSRLTIVPFLPVYLKHRLALPLAPRKSLAGFIAASLTGACIAFGFWGWIAPTPLRVERGDVTWFFNKGVFGLGAFRGWLGLGLITLFAGIVSGVAEALDLGSLDDNITLPIISGGCIWAFFKLLSAM